jgi:hypothetical protein
LLEIRDLRLAVIIYWPLHEHTAKKSGVFLKNPGNYQNGDSVHTLRQHLHRKSCAGIFRGVNGPLCHNRQFPTKPRDLTTTTVAAVEKTPRVR